MSDSRLQSERRVPMGQSGAFPAHRLSMHARALTDIALTPGNKRGPIPLPIAAGGTLVRRYTGQGAGAELAGRTALAALFPPSHSSGPPGTSSQQGRQQRRLALSARRAKGGKKRRGQVPRSKSRSSPIRDRARRYMVSAEAERWQKASFYSPQRQSS
eukprot:scaffold1954_cov268-Pinguiococcus_pyrenoidosus.AAC.310